MRDIPTYRLLEWADHKDTHPIVVEMVMAELRRRGYRRDEENDWRGVGFDPTTQRFVRV